MNDATRNEYNPQCIKFPFIGELSRTANRNLRFTFFEEHKYMGAWNYGVFDDDTAYDALSDLKASAEMIADMEKYFDEVIQAEYVGFDEAHYALVSAAVIDSVINDIHHRCDEDDYFEWTKSLKHLDFSPLKQKAVQAIDAVLSDHSELRELWEENAELYGAWREDNLSIQKRLQQ